MKAWLASDNKKAGAQEIRRVFGDGIYYNTAFGGNLHASIGFEYFPWPLFGFALEGGVRAEIWREGGIKPTNYDNLRHFDYATYEFPLGLMMHIIL